MLITFYAMDTIVIHCVKEPTTLPLFSLGIWYGKAALQQKKVWRVNSIGLVSLFIVQTFSLKWNTKQTKKNVWTQHFNGEKKVAEIKSDDDHSKFVSHRSSNGLMLSNETKEMIWKKEVFPFFGVTITTKTNRQ